MRFVLCDDTPAFAQEAPRRRPARPPQVPFTYYRTTYQIPLTDILYISRENRRMVLHLKKTSPVAGPLYYRAGVAGEAQRLAPYGIFRVQKSDLVNACSVVRVEKDRFVLQEGVTIHFNPKNYRQLFAAYLSSRAGGPV